MSLCAGDIMTRNITLIPRKMSLQGAARLLARASVTGAPIVDDNGRCVGVLSATDFMHAVEKDPQVHGNARDHAQALSQPWQIPACSSANGACVEDYMTKDPVLVSPGTRIGELACIMMDAHIHRTIVIDPLTQSPCGVVSSMDILAALARVHQALPPVDDDASLEVPSGVLNEFQHSLPR
jgi:predicted transcriptional regulator